MPEISFPERQTKTPAASVRLVSLDVLRGFDMAWLLGADALFGALFTATGLSVFAVLDTQMHHADWHGFRFYDLIFPLFIFISGVALGLQSDKVKNLSASAFYRKQLPRFFMLLALGVVYNHGWGVGIPTQWSEIRFASVLSRIAFAGFIASMLVYYLSFHQQLWFALIIFCLYSIVQAAFPFDAAHSINAIVDQALLPGKTWRNNPYDPEGLYGHIGGGLNALIGAWIGMHWHSLFARKKRIVQLILACSLVLLATAVIHTIYPINKSLWTGSFVLVTTACSTLLLIVFHLLFDFGRLVTVATFFRVIGVNAILAYLGTSIVSWSFTTQTIFKHSIALLPSVWQPVLSITLMFLLQWLLLYWLDSKRAHLKI